MILLGPQHYRHTFNKSLEAQKARDEFRRKQCENLGITLIEVPYWWDQREGIFYFIVV